MILSVEQLRYNVPSGRTIFSDVSFQVAAGEILAILGPNGAGKSTLLNCVAGLLHPATGRICLAGQDINHMSLSQVAQVLGYVPQTHHPAYDYLVRDFVVMGRTPYIGMFAQPTQADYALADHAMEELGIIHLADKPYTQISGGERQQATIARVLVQEPKVILLDEPTSHLDYGNQLRTMQLIQRLARRGFAVVFTTHMPDHVILLNSRVGVLDYSGTMVFGSVDEILTEDRLTQLYQVPLKVQYLEEIGRRACFSPGLDHQMVD